MIVYLLRRFLLMFPTFIGITLLSFFIINLAPGGPIEQRLQAIRFGSSMKGGESGAKGVNARGDQAVSQEVIEALQKQYGFDKPIHERYWLWLKNISVLDFGNSFTYEEPVINVIVSKFPVSVQFGVVSFILTYLICIPLGVWKAIKSGSVFDRISSSILFVAYSVPPLMLGILLIVFFAGGSFYNWFPIGGFRSDDYESFTFFGKVGDRIHHFILPLVCYMIGSFTTLTILMKNSMLEIIKQDYVRTARAKGLDDRKVYFKHALRNALIPIATGIGGFLGIFFAGSMIIETIFQLDGMGLLGYNSILARDYNVIMGLLFISSMVLLLGRLISDMAYVLIDPRIDFK